MNLQKITSRANPRLKALKKIQKAGMGSEEILVEGEKLIAEAMDAGLKPQSAWYTDIPAEQFPCESFLLPAAVYQSISPTKSTRPPLVVFSAPKLSFQPPPTIQGAWLLLDQVQDPGNAGTLVRAALAFGFEGVLWHQPTVFPFLHSCIRASAGAVFKLRHAVISSAQVEIVHHLKTSLIVADMHGQEVTQFSWPTPMILALGNEGHGLSEAVEACATHRIRIAMTSSVESLNVAGAGHILMHHYAASKLRI